jgi:hypothetical protein
VKLSDCDTVRPPRLGVRVTLTPVGGATTVIVAWADFEPLVTEVAVRMTAAGVGTLAGAV